MISTLLEMRGQAVFIRTDYGHSPVRHVLLLSDALVCRDQDLETGLFSPVQQDPVGQGIPAVLPSLFDDMAKELAAQLPRRPVIEQDEHG